MLSETSLDLLTGLPTRPALLAILYRETDRVQRSQQPLSLVLLDLDKQWRSQLSQSRCNAVLAGLADRLNRMLRSYDTLGRTGDNEFLLILPGCSAINANLLAERLRTEVFSAPLTPDGNAIRLSACFGVASSEGRSPIVVLQEAEAALQRARQKGPDSIETFARSQDADMEPLEFFS